MAKSQIDRQMVGMLFLQTYLKRVRMGMSKECSGDNVFITIDDGMKSFTPSNKTLCWSRRHVANDEDSFIFIFMSLEGLNKPEVMKQMPFLDSVLSKPTQHISESECLYNQRFEVLMSTSNQRLLALWSVCQSIQHGSSSRVEFNHDFI